MKIAALCRANGRKEGAPVRRAGASAGPTARGRPALDQVALAKRREGFRPTRIQVLSRYSIDYAMIERLMRRAVATTSG
jgi:hypothetical protein